MIQQETIVTLHLKISSWNLVDIVLNHLFLASGPTTSTAYSAVS